MEVKLLSILITALGNFILASYVLFKSPKRIINISFSLFAYSVGLWSLAARVCRSQSGRHPYFCSSKATDRPQVENPSTN